MLSDMTYILNSRLEDCQECNSGNRWPFCNDARSWQENWGDLTGDSGNRDLEDCSGNDGPKQNKQRYLSTHSTPTWLYDEVSCLWCQWKWVVKSPSWIRFPQNYRFVLSANCQTSVLSRLEVDFVLPLSQQQEQEQPPTKYLSCYWPDFDQTLNIGSWKHLEHILTVMYTFVQATFVLATFVHIRNITAVTDSI